jgi:hypothetical protein
MFCMAVIPVKSARCFTVKNVRPPVWALPSGKEAVPAGVKIE